MHEPIDRRAHAVLVRSIEVDPDHRSAFVEEACAGDAELEARVRNLIAALDRTEGFLESPALGTARIDTAAPPDPASVVIRGYRVVRIIASGGMATVYEAVQEQPERTVAIKVMSRALANTSAVRRFKFETEMLARLQHPGVAQIFEAGTCEDGSAQTLPFFAMEYVGGARTIVDHAVARGLTITERLTMLAQVCDAVQHGHQLGIIHRDLKPANILVDAAGRTRIIDFGVARSTNQDQATITQHADAGKLIGTLNFMSPEQCSGAADVDARTDVYSLGVVLFQLISGRLPHDLARASIPEAVRIITSERAPRLGALAAPARGDLEAICMKAMEKDRQRRYSSAGELATDIRRFLNHQTILARSPSVARQAVLFARRHKVFVGSAALLAAVVIGASIAIGLFAYQATLESRRRFNAEQTAIEERDLARRSAYIASIAGALASAQAGDHAQARQRLALAPKSLRNWEWSLASSLVDRGERTVRAHQGMVVALAATADGATLLTGAQDGSVGVWKAGGATMVTGIPGAAGAKLMSLAVTADGARVGAGNEDGTFRLWDVATGDEAGEITGFDSAVQSVSHSPLGTWATATRSGKATIWSDWFFKPLRDLDDQPGGVHGVLFSADGGQLVTWGAGGRVWVRSGDGATVRQKLDLGVRAHCAAISLDGETVAVGGNDGTFKVWRISDGAELYSRTTAPSISTVRSIAISRDGKHLAIGQIDRVIRIWSLETGEQLDTRLGHEEAVSGLVFSPDGDHLHSASWDGTLRTWPIGSALPAGPVVPLRGHDDHVLSAAYSPDGRLIASASRDATVRLWDAELGEELAVLRPDGSSVNAVAFSPDGSLLASACDSGSVRLWLTATGAPADSIGPFRGAASAVAFSPDGKRFALSGTSGVIRVWDIRSRSIVHEIPAHEKRVNALRYTPDGRVLASGSRDHSIRLWDASSGAPLPTLNGHDLDVFSLAFSADGSTLYSGSRDQTVRAWNPRTGAIRDTLPSQGQFITSISISPDGSRLAAGSWFAEVVLWDLKTNEIVASFKGSSSAIRAVAFSPDGDSLVCGGHDGSLTFYNAKPRAERAQRLNRLRAARAEAARQLERFEGLGAEEALAALKPSLQDDTWAWAQNLILRRETTPRLAPGAPTGPG